MVRKGSRDLERFGKVTEKKDHQTSAGSAERTFYECLDYHMKFGTRPDGDPARTGVEWTSTALAKACQCEDRTVRNWRNASREH
jgi:hypothetical protein